MSFCDSLLIKLITANVYMIGRIGQGMGIKMIPVKRSCIFPRTFARVNQDHADVSKSMYCNGGRRCGSKDRHGLCLDQCNIQIRKSTVAKTTPETMGQREHPV